MFDDLRCGNMVAVLLSRPLEEEEEGEEEEDEKIGTVKKNLLQAECGVNAAQVGTWWHCTSKHSKNPLPHLSRNEYKWKIKTGQRRSSHLPTGCFIHWSCCCGACWCFSPLCTRWTLGFLWNDPVSSLDCAKILCHILRRILPKIEPITVCNRMTHAIVHNYNHMNHIVNL